MKYKVGDKVVKILDEGRVLGHEKSGRVKVNWTGEGKSIFSHEWPGNIQPDYRALYEQEKALRECLERLYEFATTDNLIVNHDEWDKTAAIYRQLKQQYNGQDTATPR